VRERTYSEWALTWDRQEDFFYLRSQNLLPLKIKPGCERCCRSLQPLRWRTLAPSVFFRLKCLLPGRDTTRFKHHHPHVVALPSTHPSGYYKVHTQKTGKTLLHQFYHCRKTLTSPSHSSLISCIQTCLLKIKSFLISHILSFFYRKEQAPCLCIKKEKHS
jgi:hypothetical protein